MTTDGGSGSKVVPSGQPPSSAQRTDNQWFATDQPQPVSHDIVAHATHTDGLDGVIAAAQTVDPHAKTLPASQSGMDSTTVAAALEAQPTAPTVTAPDTSVSSSPASQIVELGALDSQAQPVADALRDPGTVSYGSIPDIDHHSIQWDPAQIALASQARTGAVGNEFDLDGFDETALNSSPRDTQPLPPLADPRRAITQRLDPSSAPTAPLQGMPIIPPSAPRSPLLRIAEEPIDLGLRPTSPADSAGEITPAPLAVFPTLPPEPAQRPSLELLVGDLSRVGVGPSFGSRLREAKANPQLSFYQPRYTSTRQQGSITGVADRGYWSESGVAALVHRYGPDQPIFSFPIGHNLRATNFVREQGASLGVFIEGRFSANDTTKRGLLTHLQTAEYETIDLTTVAADVERKTDIRSTSSYSLTRLASPRHDGEFLYVLRNGNIAIQLTAPGIISPDQDDFVSVPQLFAHLARRPFVPDYIQRKLTIDENIFEHAKDTFWNANQYTVLTKEGNPITKQRDTLTPGDVVAINDSVYFMGVVTNEGAKEIHPFFMGDSSLFDTSRNQDLARRGQRELYLHGDSTIRGAITAQSLEGRFQGRNYSNIDNVPAFSLVSAVDGQDKRRFVYVGETLVEVSKFYGFGASRPATVAVLVQPTPIPIPIPIPEAAIRENTSPQVSQEPEEVSTGRYNTGASSIPPARQEVASEAPVELDPNDLVEEPPESGHPSGRATPPPLLASPPPLPRAAGDGVESLRPAYLLPDDSLDAAPTPARVFAPPRPMAPPDIGTDDTIDLSAQPPARRAASALPARPVPSLPRATDQPASDRTYPWTPTADIQAATYTIDNDTFNTIGLRNGNSGLSSIKGLGEESQIASIAGSLYLVTRAPLSSSSQSEIVPSEIVPLGWKEVRVERQSTAYSLEDSVQVTLRHAAQTTQDLRTETILDGNFISAIDINNVVKGLVGNIGYVANSNGTLTHLIRLKNSQKPTVGPWEYRHIDATPDGVRHRFVSVQQEYVRTAKDNIPLETERENLEKAILHKEDYVPVYDLSRRVMVNSSQVAAGDLVAKNGKLFYIYQNTDPRTKHRKALGVVAVGNAVADLGMVMEYPGVAEPTFIDRSTETINLEQTLTVDGKRQKLRDIHSNTLSVALDTKGNEHYFFTIGSIHTEISRPRGHALEDVLDHNTYDVLKFESGRRYADQASHIPNAELVKMWKDTTPKGVYVVVEKEVQGERNVKGMAVEYLDNHGRLQPFHDGVKQAATALNTMGVDMAQVYERIKQAYPLTNFGNLMQAPASVQPGLAAQILAQARAPPVPSPAQRSPAPPVRVSIPRQAISTSPSFEPWYSSRGAKYALAGLAIVGAAAAVTIGVVKYQQNNPSVPAVVSAPPSLTSVQPEVMRESIPAGIVSRPVDAQVPLAPASTYVSAAPATKAPALATAAPSAAYVPAPATQPPTLPPIPPTAAPSYVSAPATQAPSAAYQPATAPAADSARTAPAIVRPSRETGQSQFYVDLFTLAQNDAPNQQVRDHVAAYCKEAFGPGTQVLDSSYSLSALVTDMLGEFKKDDQQHPSFGQVQQYLSRLNVTGNIFCR
ncbi:hypothetical protein HYV86_06585 [Candidatus Woesearchaeota archaeon]|nr:hypothetical protein [Candidatus Woesearchaeota archaeon]